MLLKTFELKDTALDWAVCEASGDVYNWYCTRPTRVSKVRDWNPSKDWSQGGPIIDKIGISLKKNTIAPKAHLWEAYSDDLSVRTSGPTPLVAAMRCFVTLKLGSEIDVADNLVL